MTRSLRRRLTVGLAAPLALGFALSACGASDVSQDTFQDDLQEQAGLPEDQAQCVTDRLFDDLDQETLNNFYSEDGAGELSSEQQDALTAAVTECVTEESGG